NTVANLLAGVPFIGRLTRQQPQQLVSNCNQETAQKTPAEGELCSWASTSDLSRRLGV
ncbi:hypothetical protein CSUI_004853, partial [Cystoisospora suis]